MFETLMKAKKPVHKSASETTINFLLPEFKTS